MQIVERYPRRALCACLLALGLAACGGGGDDPVEPDAGGGLGVIGGGGGTVDPLSLGPGADGVGVSGKACRPGRGDDPDSLDDDWGNNCWIERDAIGATGEAVNRDFAESAYTRGIQRIVWCRGYPDADDDGNQDLELAEFVDADFGPTTEMAVTDFQRDEGLGTDGIVGPGTWAALQDWVTDGEVSADGDRDRYQIDSADVFCAGSDAFYRYYEADGSTVRGWTMATKFSTDVSVVSDRGADDTYFGNGFVDGSGGDDE